MTGWSICWPMASPAGPADRGRRRCRRDRLGDRPESRQPRSSPGPASLGRPSGSPDEVEPVVDLPPLRRFSRRHLGVVAALLVVALVCAGWALFRARPVAVASPGYPVTAGARRRPPRRSLRHQLTATGAAEIVVHVLGAVRRPGLVRLPSGARVQDAIEAAGGLKRSANPDDLNLAQPLADGQQIVIGTERHPDGEVRESGGADAEPGGAPSRIDLNRATPAQLEELPGVGPVTAASIVAWREQHRASPGSRSCRRWTASARRPMPRSLPMCACEVGTAAAPGPAAERHPRNRPRKRAGPRRGTICGWPRWPWRAGLPPGAAPRAVRRARSLRRSVPRSCWRSVRYVGQPGRWPSGW